MILDRSNGELDEERIKQLIQNVYIGPKKLKQVGSFRRAAVLIPLLCYEGQWRLLFTRRAETLQEHTGQVSFPGGSVDAHDHSREETALREAYEEIGLISDDVVLMGRLQEMQTVSNYLITPIVGIIRWPYNFNLQPEEVSKTFTIPLEWLADEGNFEKRIYTANGQIFKGVVYYSSYSGEIVWGITAKITMDLLRTLQLTS